MNPFKQLISQAERVWGRTKNRLEAFPDRATRLLQDFRYALRQEQLDEFLARWLLDARPLPEQVSLHNTFGQPPITLFNNGRFVVDLYLWLSCDTSIHSHGFRGAFRVLHGKSLHETFKVKVLRRIAPGVMEYEPGIPQRTLLGAGDVCRILPGERLTHRVIHLEEPTVTLCIKTINEPGLYQWEYFPGGLALQKRDLDPDLTKQIYSFQYLLAQNAALARRFLQKLLAALSPVMRVTLHEALVGGAFDLSEDAVEEGLTQIRKLHGREAWFNRYEFPAPSHLKELNFSACEAPLQRLAAHFINAGLDSKIAGPLLSRVAGRELRRGDVEDLVRSLMDFEPIFGCELSPEDRGALRELVVPSKKRIPRHLQPFGQLPRMRKFIQSFR